MNESMTKRFFRLYDDVYVPRRWHLDTPRDSQGREVDDWQFKRGSRVAVKGRLKLPIEIAGSPLDFSETNSRIPIVHIKAASVFTELAPDDVQMIPVDVEGFPDQYLILATTRALVSIDEKASRIRLWTHEDGLPDMAGQYASVRDLRIDRTLAGSAKVFRPKGWEVALIVSEEIKTALERIGATGAKFDEV